MPLDLASKEQLEIDAWRLSETERPSADSIDNLINKLTDAPVLLEGIGRHHALFDGASVILELGAGQGWASCIIKKLVGPSTRVMATDISPYAVASVPRWERLFGVELDAAFACRSYDIPVADSSIDLVLTFQAAHHFVAHRRTLRELFRVLRGGGAALYLHEPTCNRKLHPFAVRRVNAKGMPVPEDVLVYERIKAMATSLGFKVSSTFDLSLAKRGPVELLYYSVLRVVPLLKHALPCTRDMVFTKPISLRA
jgi:SAM-dependent methyltransferase